MNTIRLLFITIILITLNGLAFSQARVDRAELSFSSESDKLKKATGWAYNSTLGEWIDYRNLISDNKDYKAKNILLGGSWLKSRENQNFIDIQTKSLDFEGETYYVLLIRKMNGGYKYPTLQLEYITFKSMFGYIFTENEYKKLININSEVVLKTTKVVASGSKYKRYNESELLDEIQTVLFSNNTYRTTTYRFPVMISDEGNIRFYLPVASYKDYDFEEAYFETSYREFNRLIIK
jgi:hypothetical protein